MLRISTSWLTAGPQKQAHENSLWSDPLRKYMIYRNIFLYFDSIILIFRKYDLKLQAIESMKKGFISPQAMVCVCTIQYASNSRIWSVWQYNIWNFVGYSDDWFLHLCPTFHALLKHSNLIEKTCRKSKILNIEVLKHKNFILILSRIFHVWQEFAITFELLC